MACTSHKSNIYTTPSACTCQCNYGCTCYCNYACTCNCNYGCKCNCNYRGSGSTLPCSCQSNYSPGTCLPHYSQPDKTQHNQLNCTSHTVTCPTQVNLTSCEGHNATISCTGHTTSQCVGHDTTVCPGHDNLAPCPTNYSCPTKGTCPGQKFECPSNVTVWDQLSDTDLRNTNNYSTLRTAINKCRTQRELNTKTFSTNLNMNNNELFEFVLEIKDSVQTIKAQTWIEQYINSDNINTVRKQIDELRSKINVLEFECLCNCNYCTCECNYCTCQCNYACTCKCNYSCTCQCNYACTCNCNYTCTCRCNYCTCNCNYACTCNCNYCTCQCNYACTCECNYCACNCAYMN